MKNLVALIIFITTVISLLIYNLYKSNKEIESNLKLSNKIAQISHLNTNLQVFSKSHSQFKNYDLIDKDIKEIQKIYKIVLENKDYKTIKENNLYKKLEEIRKLIEKQIDLIEKQKSYDAIYNNSLRNIQKIKSTLDSTDYDLIYNTALTLDFEKDMFTSKVKNMLKEFTPSTENEIIFLRHINIVFDYYSKKYELVQEIKSLNLQNELNLLIDEFERYSNQLLEKIKQSIVLFLIILVFMIIFLVYYSYEVLKNKLELSKMQKALEISDNIIVITDKNHKIKYVNKGFEKTTGYKKEEVIGKSPSILKSGKLSLNFYKNLHETIHSGKEWHGEIVNKNKSGEITYEKSSIIPIKNEDGEIIEFLAIKSNVTKEKEYQNIFLQQSKMASMGELLENISHQWRQPLSIVSSLSSAQILKLEINENLDKNELKESYKKILDTANKLSNTIDDLKNFFNEENEIFRFNIKDTLEKSLHLFNLKLERNDINITIESEEIVLDGQEKELIQALINIYNNCLDAFTTNEIENRQILIVAKNLNSNLLIEISDNAGGIDEQILNKVFDLYFTTKHKYGGTGIGLYVTYQIITQIFNGKIHIENSEMIIDNKKEKGTKVFINIPII